MSTHSSLRDVGDSHVLIPRVFECIDRVFELVKGSGGFHVLNFTHNSLVVSVLKFLVPLICEFVTPHLIDLQERFAKSPDVFFYVGHLSVVDPERVHVVTNVLQNRIPGIFELIGELHCLSRIGELAHQFFELFELWRLSPSHERLLDLLCCLTLGKSSHFELDSVDLLLKNVRTLFVDCKLDHHFVLWPSVVRAAVSPVPKLVEPET